MKWNDKFDFPSAENVISTPYLEIKSEPKTYLEDYTKTEIGQRLSKIHLQEQLDLHGGVVTSLDAKEKAGLFEETCQTYISPPGEYDECLFDEPQNWEDSNSNTNFQFKCEQNDFDQDWIDSHLLSPCGEMVESHEENLQSLPLLEPAVSVNLEQNINNCSAMQAKPSLVTVSTTIQHSSSLEMNGHCVYQQKPVSPLSVDHPLLELETFCASSAGPSQLPMQSQQSILNDQTKSILLSPLENKSPQTLTLSSTCSIPSTQTSLTQNQMFFSQSVSSILSEPTFATSHSGSLDSMSKSKHLLLMPQYVLETTQSLESMGHISQETPEQNGIQPITIKSQNKVRREDKIKKMNNVCQPRNILHTKNPNKNLR